MSILSWLGSTWIASTARACDAAKRQAATAMAQAMAPIGPIKRRLGAALPVTEALNSPFLPDAFRRSARLTTRVSVEQRVKQMILPNAVDSQIATREPFALETGLFQQSDRGRVARDAGRLEPVQFERVEHEGHNGANGCGHITLIGVFGPDPIAERAGLGHPAAHVAEREPADEHAGGDCEDEQRVAYVLAKIAQIMANAPAKRGARELVGGPQRLPRGQELPAPSPELRPFGIVRHLRRPQRDFIGLDDGPDIAGRYGSQ